MRKIIITQNQKCWKYSENQVQAYFCYFYLLSMHLWSVVFSSMNFLQGSILVFFAITQGHEERILGEKKNIILLQRSSSESLSSH